MPEEDIIPNHFHADDAALEKWFDRVMMELGGYNSFPGVVRIVTEALARYASEQRDSDDVADESDDAS